MARFSLLVLAALVCASGSAHAEGEYDNDPNCSAVNDPGFTGHCMGPSTTNAVKLYAFRLYNSTTRQFVVVGEGERIFDTAQASVGSVIGDYVSNAQIPFGTYTTASVITDPDSKMSGEVTLASGQYCRTATSSSADKGSNPDISTAPGTPGIWNVPENHPAGSDADYVPGNNAEYQLADGRLVSSKALTTPVTITADSPPVVFEMQFSETRALRYAFTGGTCTHVGIGDYDAEIALISQ